MPEQIQPPIYLFTSKVTIGRPALALSRQFFVAAISLLTLSVGSVLAGPQYKVTDLGPYPNGAPWIPPEGSCVGAAGINASGQVVGSSNSAVGLKALLDPDGTGPQPFITLGNLGGKYGAIATGINDSGQVTGYSYTDSNPLPPHTIHAFLDPDGVGPATMSDLGTLGGTNSIGSGINAVGQVTGNSFTLNDIESHAFIDPDGIGPEPMFDLRTLGGTGSSGNDINDLGHVTGGSFIDGDAESHTFIDPDGTGPVKMVDIEPPKGSGSAGLAINASDQVAGVMNMADGTRHAFIDPDGIGPQTMKDLGTLPGMTSSSGAGINSKGQVVGSSMTAQGINRAFIDTDGAGPAPMQDLNGLILQGLFYSQYWVLNNASDINDAGQIVGDGFINRVGSFNNDGPRHCFLLTPDTTPPSITCPADVQSSVDQPAIGKAVAKDNLDPNPTITNNAPALFALDRTTRVTWTAQDAAGNIATCIQNVTISAPTNPPIAQADLFLFNAWQAPAVASARFVPAPGILRNDANFKGTPLSAILGAAPAAGLGRFSLYENGSFAYTPSAGITAASFTYLANDGALSSLTPALVQLRANTAPTVTPENCTYTRATRSIVGAACKVIATTPRVKLRINLVANDRDPNTQLNVASDGVGKRVVSSSVKIKPLLGAQSTVLNKNGTLDVTLAANFKGIFRYSYSVADDLGLRSKPLVNTVTVK